jgi:hypothetical protein
MPKWRSEYRRCDNCRSEYRPKREAQSYCSRDCRRAAAYGRERFKAGTVGRRKRRLEASDKLPGTLVAGSFRNCVFSSIEPTPCKATNPGHSATFDHWPRCKVCKRWKLLPRDGLPRHMFCIAVRKDQQRVARVSGPAPLVQALGTEVPGLTSQEVSVSSWLPRQ